jgi:arylsulfatase A-like enzyme
VAPNILLVVLDAVRRDTIEPYGPPPGTTPAIADLARAGSALPNAYATASWTLPSHASMFTGLLARQLGLGQAPDGSPQSARPLLERARERMLSQVLRQNGYTTRGFSANLWVSPHSGFDLGFDTFVYRGEHRRMARGALVRARPDASLTWALDGLRARVDDGAGTIRNGLVDAIEHWSGQPTFWFVNLCECHSPYLPPRPWNDLPVAERVRAALDAQQHLSFQSICLYAAGRHEIPAEAFERMRYLYRRAAAYMDRWLAEVLEALERRSILDETLVIVTSDHGENFGEGGLIAHGFSVDQRLIHVPLVLAGPGAVDHAEPFSLAQLPPLICRAAGIDAHPWQARELPEDVAVAEFDRLGAPDHPRITAFAEQWHLDDAAVGRITNSYTCATDGRHKLVIGDDGESCYDLETDPSETRPRPPAEMGGLDGLRAALAHPSTRAPAAASVPGAVPAAPSAASAEELAAIERQMKLLGYM